MKLRGLRPFGIFSSLFKSKNSGSKYKPHQGEREKYRRRVGGFHCIKREENMRKQIEECNG